MPDFSKRSYEKELLDRTDIPFQDIQRNMEELEVINSVLGGHKITIDGLKGLIKKKQGSLSVCEIGCGGGDNLKAIYKWCARRKLPVKGIGIDINPDCVAYAKENCAGLPAVEFIVADYRDVDFANNRPDIIFSSLFTHHLDEQQFIAMLQWSKQFAGMGFFINDLHRHPAAYHSIRILSRIFSKSYLVKNDAPLSVARGFKRKEIEELLQKAGITHFTIRWQWAFRWLIIVNT